MIAALVACSLALAPAAEEFFPLVPGTKWHYQITGQGGGYTSRDSVGSPAEFGGKTAIPIESSTGSPTYYRVEGDTVYLVGYSPKRPLETPIPILKITDRAEKWDYYGVTDFMGAAAPLTMKARSQKGRKRKILGKEVETWESSYEGTLSHRPPDVDGPGTNTVVKQSAVYARGIGLVEMTNEGKVGKSSSKYTMRLVQFEPGKPDTP